MKLPVVLIVAGALCVAGLVAMKAKTNASAVGGADGSATREFCVAKLDSAPLGARVAHEGAATVSENENAVRVERVKSIIGGMSARAQSEISINDYDAFLADLDATLDFNKKSAGADVPLLVLVDKAHSLSADYVPAHLVPLVANDEFNLNKEGMSLRPEAYDALRVMARAALDDGIKLLVSSAYRSYSYQENLFNYWSRVDGVEEAERVSARPGKSQHQLGTAVDFGSISDDFAETRMGRWMYEHAADYGWSLSFPQGYEDVTGYRWECWHFRYVGREAIRLQQTYFNDVQQYMIEFLDAWEKDANY